MMYTFCLFYQAVSDILPQRRIKVQGSTNRRALGFVNFVLALAYHFCLHLPAAFSQPGARLLVEPCIWYVICVFEKNLPGTQLVE